MEELDDIMVLASDIRMIGDLDERITESKGEIELISFADGERIMLAIPADIKTRLTEKGDELLELLKQKVALIKD